MKKVWIIAGGVVLVAAVSAPWAVGKLTEQHWQSATEQFNASQPYFVMETESYERGYLGSEAHGQLFAVDPDTGERYPLGWTGDISHGVTSSTIDFDFDFADDAGMEAVFPDEKPTVTVTTSAWGSSLVELNVPAIDYTDDSSGESLNVSASYATLNISEDGETLDARMQLPGLVLRGPDVRVSMENLNLDQHASLLTGKLWTGEATVTLDKVSVTSRDEPELVLEKLEMVSNSDADSAGEKFGLATTLTLDKVHYGDESQGPHTFRFGLSDVSVAAWNDMLEAVNQLQAMAVSGSDNPQQAFEQQMQATMALTGSIEAMMADGLSTSAELDLSSPDGPVTGRLVISHPEQADGEPVPLMMIARTIEGEMSVKLPRALADRYPELGEELMPLLIQGVLEEEGDFYVMEASLSNMMVNLNGNEMPLPVPGMGAGLPSQM
ncbi:Uncharacterized conserved protein YdgA, DUF945 family [Marinobacter segnicrescens]|uniref:Uncharacterized conserved protein YdgA, DUF945 family n=1 Tax=Marinobacter segnicrescens TaxID=430453 RepID=A0A1I0FTN8_9GAMM|nr:DUF945 family protein [Marinobacter segnicrescens]SET61806.1 Uncharacterized conserved protein YdgA, DUF945 family [Marinobacter segnicrescens]